MYLIDGEQVWSPAATFGGVIDISHWNGSIIWRNVPKSIVMVMIKATQGAGDVDRKFAVNRDGALASGRLVVPYHFLTFEPVALQLQNFSKVIGNSPGLTYAGPVMIDWEGKPRPSIAVMEAFGDAAADLVKRPPLAYHGMYDPSAPMIQEWPWMLPKYGPAPQGVKWLFWQDRPNLHVPGIPSLVDHSVFAGTEAELRAWHATGALPKGF
jgi:GH25 family lysozyme M1 (1,4-beta-N-acetylmuramidase)